MSGKRKTNQEKVGFFEPLTSAQPLIQKVSGNRKNPLNTESVLKQEKQQPPLNMESVEKQEKLQHREEKNARDSNVQEESGGEVEGQPREEPGTRCPMLIGRILVEKEEYW